MTVPPEFRRSIRGGMDGCLCRRGDGTFSHHAQCPVHAHAHLADAFVGACTCPTAVDGRFDPSAGCPVHGALTGRRVPRTDTLVDAVIHGPDCESATCTGDCDGAEPAPDHYQERYTAHQKRKADTLRAIIRLRHSDRMFGDPITVDELQQITQAAQAAPSSCDRHGVTTYPVEDRDQKALLGGLLVGGVGWVHRAPTVFLLWAARSAYKAPGELAYMPYVDAGVMVQNMWLTATSLDLAAAYVNPNIREENEAFFHDRFIPADGVFCGALAVGRRHPDSPDHAHAVSRAGYPDERRGGDDDGVPT